MPLEKSINVSIYIKNPQLEVNFDWMVVSDTASKSSKPKPGNIKRVEVNELRNANVVLEKVPFENAS